MSQTNDDDEDDAMMIMMMMRIRWWWPTLGLPSSHLLDGVLNLSWSLQLYQVDDDDYDGCHDCDDVDNDHDDGNAAADDDDGECWSHVGTGRSDYNSFTKVMVEIMIVVIMMILTMIMMMVTMMVMMMAVISRGQGALWHTCPSDRSPWCSCIITHKANTQ